MAGDDAKPDASKPSDVAEALKNTRTSALKALNKAAAQLDVAIAKDQFSVTSDLGKLKPHGRMWTLRIKHLSNA